MIWVALIGLPVMILITLILMLAIPETDVPGGRTRWYLGTSAVLLVLSASFITHLKEFM